MMNELVFNFIYDAAGNLPPRVIIFFADYLGWLILLVVLFVLVARYGLTKLFWQRVLLVCLSGCTAWLVTMIIKLSYLLPRPAQVLDLVLPLTNASGSSFPSAHAAFFMAVAYGVDRLRCSSTYIILIISAVVVGIARVAAGVHWPADILAGWLLGVLVGYFINVLAPWTGVKNRLPV